MSNFASNGWGIYFHPQLFATQYKELFERVSRLREQLPEAEYKTHTTVKLFAAITVAIESKIPSDPFASHFTLTGALKRYGRVKKMGLPERYRLFFRAFDTEELKVIVILWLEDVLKVEGYCKKAHKAYAEICRNQHLVSE
ncbi:type II toxin-antitoxin system YhaV family toxin [Nostoc sp. LEGE 12450]|uniref:type II toxin-antitoxin system YhaV family toxin n=1 Tax=Nostoc sp. LEGE 12450 TaxID=1828643 RepID=UPI00187EC61D|nr:type II toxin-antitoxin system YhaV family toxin [Nostoc sp. LEGE 12450]MBE8992492.1 type II toxin-antitoxin system YhaV family toxin [Nostoc sp. LEGE 12450]